MPDRSTKKAARLVVLYELDQAGIELDLYTLQSLADLFGTHRSTILRDLRMLEEIRKMVPEYKLSFFRRRIPLKNNPPSNI